ncbi:hypothetical protein [Brucella pituitosa]|uniref:Uncharacterized protein n=1 Tax=Brucella pituitosa TaxID=571256 RepID=A0ABS3K292_9HYPH|nr:hypothetical protein [Brucella pituitosa]MBO1040460.1 hypothetical protein [Brucella pituitosa]
MSNHEEWSRIGRENGWLMPNLGILYRIPIIRHILVFRDAQRIERWYSAVPGVRTGYDEWVQYGIWWGLTRPTGGSDHGE